MIFPPEPVSARARRHLVVAVAVATAMLAGCGGGQADSPGDAADADLVLTATEFAFDPSAPTVDGGQITVAIDNEGSVPHTWVVEGLEDQLELDAAAGELDGGTIELAPGTYTFYCDVPGHREAGMEGIVTVE